MYKMDLFIASANMKISFEVMEHPTIELPTTMPSTVPYLQMTPFKETGKNVYAYFFFQVH